MSLALSPALEDLWRRAATCRSQAFHWSARSGETIWCAYHSNCSRRVVPRLQADDAQIFCSTKTPFLLLWVCWSQSGWTMDANWRAANWLNVFETTQVPPTSLLRVASRVGKREMSDSRVGTRSDRLEARDPSAPAFLRLRAQRKLKVYSSNGRFVVRSRTGPTFGLPPTSNGACTACHSLARSNAASDL